MKESAWKMVQRLSIKCHEKGFNMLNVFKPYIEKEGFKSMYGLNYLCLLQFWLKCEEQKAREAFSGKPDEFCHTWYNLKDRIRNYLKEE